MQVAHLVSAIHEAESLQQKLVNLNRQEDAAELEAMTETVISIAALFLRHRFAALNLDQHRALTQLQERLALERENVQRG